MQQIHGRQIPYFPLGSNSSEIRLLRLLGKQFNDTDIPSCEIFHASFDDNPQYEALSYIWGDASLQGKIRLDGRTQLVTQNLARALSDIRDNESKMLWVDALCIDQGNFSERNHQVKQMGRIYHSALRVLVWLGRPAVTDDWPRSDGLSTLKMLNKILLGSPAESNPASTLLKSISDPKSWLQWHELVVLCELPYWNRLWIVQEVGLARELKVYYGRASVNWIIFNWVREELGRLFKWELCPPSFLPLGRTILESKMEIQFISHWGIVSGVPDIHRMSHCS